MHLIFCYSNCPSLPYERNIPQNLLPTNSFLFWTYTPLGFGNRFRGKKIEVKFKGGKRFYTLLAPRPAGPSDLQKNGKNSEFFPHELSKSSSTEYRSRVSSCSFK